MPIYEFICENCDNEFSIFGKYESVMLSKKYCPSCKSSKIKRKYKGFSVIFKGNGFYKTDNKGNNE